VGAGVVSRRALRAALAASGQRADSVRAAVQRALEQGKARG